MKRTSLQIAPILKILITIKSNAPTIIPMVKKTTKAINLFLVRESVASFNCCKKIRIIGINVINIRNALKNNDGYNGFDNPQFTAPISSKYGLKLAALFKKVAAKPKINTGATPIQGEILGNLTKKIK